MKYGGVRKWRKEETTLLDDEQRFSFIIASYLSYLICNNMTGEQNNTYILSVQYIT